MVTTAMNSCGRMNPMAMFLIIVAGVVTINVPSAEAFAPAFTTTGTAIQQRESHPNQRRQPQTQNQRQLSQHTPLQSTASSTPTPASPPTKTLVLISPPGGLGEITAIDAALLGTSVRWFIVSPPATPTSPPSRTSFPSATLDAIAAAGGSVIPAGATADTLLLPKSDPYSSVSAVEAWCSATGGGGVGGEEGVVVVIDGIGESVRLDAAFKEEREGVAAEGAVMDAIKVATREVSAAVRPGMRVALVPADMEVFLDGEEECELPQDGMVNKEVNEASRLLEYVTNPFRKEEVDVPTNLFKAMGGGCEGTSKIVTLRYGELFGVPESSINASPFVGGPRRDPVLRDEYTMRSVRIDPTLSLSGNSMLSDATRTSRLSLASLASLTALSLTPPLPDDLDVCLTSLRGLDPPTREDWDQEFERVEEIMEDTGGSGAQLFRAEFGGVPDTGRLADWLASKWAPTVLRTYDIAGIRVGARPVFASRVGDTEVVIEWQILRDFDTFVVGKMTIDVDETGITAVRGAGDEASGYGTVSRKPLPGEDILVRRLSDAVTQAVEKGLATKPKPKKRAKKIETVEKPVVVSTMLSSGTVAAEAVPTAVEPAAASETGPRGAGTRRSAKRKRGTRKEAGTEPTEEEEASSSTPSPPVPPAEESQTESWQ